MAKGKPIHLNPANKGKFTAKAKRAGMGVDSYAAKVLLSGSGASKKTREEAQFAVNAKKFNHKRK